MHKAARAGVRIGRPGAAQQRAGALMARITGEGGIEPSEPLTIINKTSQLGGCKPDEDTSAKGSMSGPV
jgi:hypothetical protein